MTIGRDTQCRAINFKQHTVEVVTNVLVRHRELRFSISARNQPGQRDFNVTLPVFNIWKIVRGNVANEKSGCGLNELVRDHLLIQR